MITSHTLRAMVTNQDATGSTYHEFTTVELLKFDYFAYRVVECLMFIGKWSAIVLLVIIMLAFFAGMHCDTTITFP